MAFLILKGDFDCAPFESCTREYYLTHFLPATPTILAELPSASNASPEFTTHRELLLGAGGAYTRESLAIRAMLLRQMEAQITMMNNDLTIFLNAVVALTNK